MTCRERLTKTSSSAPVVSVWVNYNSGKASSIVLMNEESATIELRGAQMWRWLREWSQPWQAPKTARYKSQTSLVFGNDDPQAVREDEALLGQRRP